MPFVWIILFAFLCSKFGNYITIKVAKQQQLVEATDHRKIHTEKVAALGGIPIFITLVVFYFTIVGFFNPFSFLLLAAFFLLAVGLWDDLKNIGIKRRLITQFIVANVAYLLGFHFEFSTTLVGTVINYFSTIIFIGLMINGSNFLDGINGLAGGLGVLITSIFAIIFYNCGANELTIMAVIYVGAILGFLSYNFGERAAIFMGDSGSTVMGFLLAIFALKAWSFSGGMDNTNVLASIAMGLIALPILDLFGVVITRITKGQSPLEADRNHIHHLLIDTGKSHPEACWIVYSWIVSLVALLYFGEISSIALAFILIVGSYIVIRVSLSTIKPPVVSPVKWDKPVQQPTPIV